MKTLVTTFFLIMVLSSFSQEKARMTYEVDVTQNLDTFYVSLSIDAKLKKSSKIYQFASTAPGTYQTMNIGRLISDFEAFDKKGRLLNTDQISINQFQIEKPKKVKSISYKVAETFDTYLDDYPIYLMAGSSIEADHTLINTHTMIGYFEGYQKAPFKIKVVGNDDWKAGSALSRSGDYFVAENFDHAVDSPILMGELSFADTTIADTKVKIYTYSYSDIVDSDMLLNSMSDMLDASRKFLVKLPVEEYTFLYFFEPDLVGTTGAWEHSYSSEYVLKEGEPTETYLQDVTDIASHEFFHIVTPLNIHSEVVESFNFVEPTTSVHLWLYEGVTEWASNILLFRGGVVDLEDYLTKSVAFKILVDEQYFDSSWSLKKLADESFKGGEGAQQYGNIYYRGSLVAGLLDIRLLELSGGEYGLRELMLDLVNKYGKGKPMSEERFFDDIAEMTYPGIRDFFDQYVLEANPLPHAEYLSKIGLQLTRDETGKPSVSKIKEMTSEQKVLFEAWSKSL